MFETKRARGWFLLIVLIVVLIAGGTANWWASAQAGKRQKVAETRLHLELSQTTVPALLVAPLKALPHFGEVRTVQRDADGVAVTIGVNTLWQYRCVVGHLGEDGRITTKRVQCGPPQ